MLSQAALLLLSALGDASPLAFHVPTRIGIPTQNGRPLAALKSRPHINDFTVEQVAHNTFYKSGPAAYSHALSKYNAQVPAHVQAAVRYGPPSGYGPPPGYGGPPGYGPTSSQPPPPAETGSVTTNPEMYDQAYLSPVQIGTPPQTLMLDFDTGSADLWVFSAELPAAQQSGHDSYNPAASTTSSRLNGSTWTIMYGDGSGASGDVYLDTVAIGGVTAKSQAVEAARSISSAFVEDTQNDGLVGLAFKSINQVRPVQQNQFMDNVGPALSNDLFTATLKRGAPGYYDFGYINASRYTDSIVYTPIDNSFGFWNFTAGDTYAGETNTGALGSAIADTGTTLVLIDDSLVRAYYNQVDGSGYSISYGGYLFPCTSTLPDWSLTIEGERRTIPGEYINYAPVEGTPYCYGGIQSNQGLPFSIIGDIFLKSQFVVFSRVSLQIGFAPQAPDA